MQAHRVIPISTVQQEVNILVNAKQAARTLQTNTLAWSLILCSNPLSWDRYGQAPQSPHAGVSVACLLRTAPYSVVYSLTVISTSRGRHPTGTIVRRGPPRMHECPHTFSRVCVCDCTLCPSLSFSLTHLLACFLAAARTHCVGLHTQARCTTTSPPSMHGRTSHALKPLGRSSRMCSTSLGR